MLKNNHFRWFKTGEIQVFCRFIWRWCLHTDRNKGKFV